MSALREHETFNRAQVAWLMAQAQRWGYDVGWEEGQLDGFVAGYQLCEDEWNAEAAGRLNAFTARDARDGDARDWLVEQADLAARLPRITDRRGGAADMWGDEPGDMQVAA
uniref:hypothetical protein n=1 Tax=Paractinoplanes polyasparticus TaxID=2856853 RepID=UPI001C840C98|nr:hypothetical protein [Actinoplanes polyasparticus]